MILTIKSKCLHDGHLRYIQLRELAYREIERPLRGTSVKTDISGTSAERLAFCRLDEYARRRHLQLTYLPQLRERKRVILRRSRMCPGTTRLYKSSRIVVVAIHCYIDVLRLPPPLGIQRYVVRRAVRRAACDSSPGTVCLGVPALERIAWVRILTD